MNNKTVKAILATLPKGEKIYYRSNPGNAGDALIATGAFSLFEQAGLDIELVNPCNFDSSGKIVIYAGGGNLVKFYPEAREFFLRFHKNAKQFILLPHTVDNNIELLSQLGSNVTLFAREKVTYQHLKEHATGASVFLDDDLAFQLDAQAMLALPQIGLANCISRKIIYKLTSNKLAYSRLPQPAIMFRNSMFEFRSRFSSVNIGNFFRTDIESALPSRPLNNTDLSRMYEYGTRNKEVCLYTVSRLFRFLDSYTVINTDRLHICIAGALLGKTVNLYPNSYFKCKAIYEHSLKDKFQNVNFCTDF